MGCPDKFYRLALENLAYCLNSIEMQKEYNQFYCNLKDFIYKSKSDISKEEFNSLVNQVCEDMIERAKETGCDALNACIGGLNEFMQDIGLEED